MFRELLDFFRVRENPDVGARSDDRVTSISVDGYWSEILAAGIDVVGRSRNSATDIRVP